jgi:hypothetical protein
MDPVKIDIGKNIFSLNQQGGFHDPKGVCSAPFSEGLLWINVAHIKKYTNT